MAVKIVRPVLAPAGSRRAVRRLRRLTARRHRLLRLEALEVRTVLSTASLIDTVKIVEPGQNPIASAESEIANFQTSSRWSSTATNGGGLTQGDPTTLTWSITPDGTPIPGFEGESASASSLISFMDTIRGQGPGGSDLTQRPWFNLFVSAFGRLAAVSGLTYVYEPKDDGKAFSNDPSAAPGVLGTRGDIRVGGHFVDGQNGANILAYAFFPDSGDMVIDTGNTTSFGSTTNDSVLFRDVLMHEGGHGVGLDHVESSDADFLMEPFINTAFDGPQLDDILALQRDYGDPYEENLGNNSTQSATSLGSIGIGQTVHIGTGGSSTVVAASNTDFVSIDDESDVDYFKFTTPTNALVSLTLTPRGTTYQQGPQGGPQTAFNSAAQSDLSLAVLDRNGTTILQSVNAAGIGGTESIPQVLLATAGTYYARVTASTLNQIQLYGLDVSVALTAPETDVSLASGNLAITDVNGGTTDDSLTLTLNGTKVRIFDPNVVIGAGAGATQVDLHTVEVPLASITGKIQVNTLGGNDSLALALGNGDFIPAGGLTYDGGDPTSGTGDKLFITGSNLGTVAYGYLNSHDGSVVLGTLGTVNYAGLESITNSGSSTNVVFNLPATPNVATLADDGTSGNQLSRLSGATIVTTDFATPAAALTINRGNVADTLSLNTLPDFNSSLTIGAAGSEFGGITFAAGLTLMPNKNLAAFATGTISLPNATSDLATSGGGAIVLTTARDITLVAGASITTADGGIALTANQQATRTSGNFVGIVVDGATITSSGAAVSLSGRGGTDTGGNGFNSGVVVSSAGAKVSGGGAGTAVNIQGLGGGAADDVNGGNYGVYVTRGLVTSIGSGAVIVNGTGGSSNSTGQFTEGFNRGVFVSGGGTITSGGGNVVVTGTGGSGSFRNVGVELDTAGVITTGGGNLSVTGSGGGGLSISDGVRIQSAQIAATGTGTLTIEGAVTSGNSCGLAVGFSSAVKTANNAALTLITDCTALDVDGISAGAGTVTLRPRTAGTAIEVGGFDVPNGSPPVFGVQDYELNSITAGAINIGDINSGPITIGPDVVLTTATNINLKSGGAINFTDGLLDTAGGNLTLSPGSAASVGVDKTGTDVNVGSSGTLSFSSGSELSIAISGATTNTQLNVAGNVDLTGVDLLLSGSYVPVAGGSFTLVDNDGADAIVGAFNNLPEGKVVNINGVNTRITYVGGTGNDVVLDVLDAPVLDATKNPALSAVDEDAPAPSGAVGTLVSSLVDFATSAGGIDNVSDGDVGALLGIAVTAVDPKLTCYYTLNGGTTWAALGAVSDTTSRLLAADSNSRIYCRAGLNQNGTFASPITFRAWDQTTGSDGGLADTSVSGGTTAFSTATDGVSLTVNAINDAPTRKIATASLAAIDEDTDAPPGNSVSNLFSSDFDDIDATTIDAGGVAIIANAATAAQGTWQVMVAGGAFTDLPTLVDSTAIIVLAANDKIRFLPADNFNGMPGALTTRLWDGTGGFAAAASVQNVAATIGGTGGFSDNANEVTLSTSVTPVNDAPTRAAATATLAAIAEDTPAPGGGSVSSLFGSAFADVDGTTIATGGVAIVANAATAAQGTWQIRVAGGAFTDLPSLVDATGVIVLGAGDSIRFVPAHDYNGTPGSLTVRLWDGTGGFLTKISSQDISGGLGPTAAFSDNANEVTLNTAITAVNDPPSFKNQSGDISVGDEDPTTHGPSSRKTITAWATEISAGPSDESTQTRFFHTENDNPSLFTVQPIVNSTGVLIFQAAANKHGTATVSVYLQDNGDGTNTSPVVTFHIEVVKTHRLHNSAEAGGRNGLDVTGSTSTQPDGFIVSADVLAVVNYINAKGSGHVPANANYGPPYVDVNGDDEVVADDVVKVINWINAHPGQSEGEDSPASSEEVETNNNASSVTGQAAESADLISLLAFDAAEAQSKRRRA
jgi:hypothetical protein